MSKRIQLPIPPWWGHRSRKAWMALSPYLQRKNSIPPEQRLFSDPMQYRRSGEMLRDHGRDFDLLHKGQMDRALHRPKNLPRFWQLPPEVRAEAQAYEDFLCRKFADRIRLKPGLRHVLHMSAINRFKNPGQERQAAMYGHNITAYRASRKSIALRRLEDRNNRPPSVHHLDLGLT